MYKPANFNAMTSDKLKISDDVRSFSLDNIEISKLGTKINNSTYGYIYFGISDHLFNFVKYKQGNERRPSSYLTVTKDQYDVLFKMYSESK